MKSIIGRKIGMTSVFAEDGSTYPVTVVEVLPNVVTQVKTLEKDGYEALQIGYEEKKENRREPKKEQPKREPKPEPVVVERSEEEIAAIKKAAQDFLKEVFAAMELGVEINIQYNKENGNLEIDFAGDDMGILIGKRGQTLDSLQYLTSLVVNKNENAYVRVKLDTENYRSRRKDTLENLAKNIAFKVKKTRKPVSLEPMNPYERRIIHSALQGNKFVETYSEGNEPYRHVVVTLKKNAYYQRDEK